MRIRETSFYVMAALQDAPLHGYAILQRILQNSPNASVPVATLYGTLDRLSGDGLVEIHSEEIVDGRARRSFRLTERGRGVLEEEADRMRAAASLVKRRTVGAKSRTSVVPT